MKGKKVIHVAVDQKKHDELKRRLINRKPPSCITYWVREQLERALKS